MARKNLFHTEAVDGLRKGRAIEEYEPGAVRQKLVGASRMLVEGVKGMIRDIPTDLISESKWSMRLPDRPEDLNELVESIRAHGQAVPALVRPSAGKKGYFEVVGGHRRLAAVRQLGYPLKARIDDIGDIEALLTQGADNNHRLAKSFIEQAVFSSRLKASGRTVDLICETVGISPAILSQMEKVVREIDEDLLLQIGPCHGVGRLSFVELAGAVEQLRIRGIALGGPDLSQETDVERLEAFRNHVDELLAGKTSALGSDGDTVSQKTAADLEADVVSAQSRFLQPSDDSFSREMAFGPNGSLAVLFSVDSDGVTIRFDRTPDTADFPDWLENNIEGVLSLIEGLWLLEAAQPKIKDR